MSFRVQSSRWTICAIRCRAFDVGHGRRTGLVGRHSRTVIWGVALGKTGGSIEIRTTSFTWRNRWEDGSIEEEISHHPCVQSKAGHRCTVDQGFQSSRPRGRHWDSRIQWAWHHYQAASSSVPDQRLRVKQVNKSSNWMPWTYRWIRRARILEFLVLWVP